MADFETAKAAIRAYIEANWDGVSIVWPNAGFGAEGIEDRPRDGDGNPIAFIYCEILPTSSRGSGFGSVGKRVKTDAGVVAAHYMAPIGTGDEQAGTAIKAFGEMLELRSIGAPPAPRMEAAQPGGGGQGDDDGLYFRVSRTVPWSINYAA